MTYLDETLGEGGGGGGCVCQLSPPQLNHN